MTIPWPPDDDWVWNGPLGPPPSWSTPGLVMTFNLECAGCVSRGVPLLKRLDREAGGRLRTALVHTSHGHRAYRRDEVEPALVHFASQFARLEMPVAVDVTGDLARAWQTEGTPHWLAFDATGTMVRSFFGSQANAASRLAYLVEELIEHLDVSTDDVTDARSVAPTAKPERHAS